MIPILNGFFFQSENSKSYLRHPKLAQKLEKLDFKLIILMLIVNCDQFIERFALMYST